MRITITGGERRLYVDLHYACVQSCALITVSSLLQLMRRYPGNMPDVDLTFDCKDRLAINHTEHGNGNPTAPSLSTKSRSTALSAPAPAPPLPQPTPVPIFSFRTAAPPPFPRWRSPNPHSPSTRAAGPDPHATGPSGRAPPRRRPPTPPARIRPLLCFAVAPSTPANGTAWNPRRVVSSAACPFASALCCTAAT
ncbi:hypothetical protein ACP70R_042719 [Stipagrostis hirtigluma subsp. patula]